MCGIAGILRVHACDDCPAPDAALPSHWLDLLDDSIRHRGPDDSGRFRDRARRADGRLVDVALVHRRLAIIDPQSGVQPLVTGRDSDLLATVFNGCIYNHRELRRQLQDLGRRFQTHHSDTEVIPHAHAAWGDDAPARLDGMFAYATWTRARADLVLACDAAGEKPLYHTGEELASSGIFVFASSAAAIGRWLACYGLEFAVPRLTCDPHAALEWLRFGWGVQPLLRGVHALAPNTLLHPFANGLHTVSHARRTCRTMPTRTADAHANPGATTPQLVDETISRAVRSRLEADVPLGCLLSGGVDSTLVAWHARKALGALRTFTIRMPDARYDESAFAAQAAAVIGSDHTTLDCDPRPADDLPELIAQLGLPFADSSLLPTTWVCRAARRHVKVVLTGDAGDELFAGYERHIASRLLRRARIPLRLIPATLAARAHPKSLLSKLGRLGLAARGGYSELLAIFPRSMLAQLVPAHRAQLARDTDFIPSDAPRRDFDDYLPYDLLRKTDTAAMSIALETRAPLLAREVIDLGLSTPLSVLTLGGRKGLLRAAARLHLPTSIVDRPKMGFALPVGEWFRNDYGSMRTLLQDELRSRDPFPSDLLGLEIDKPAAARLLDQHLSGSRDHSQRLYALLVLALWHKEVARWRR